MAIVRWEPFRDLVGLQDRMNRLFDESFRGINRPTTEDDWALGGAWAPVVDIYEREGTIILDGTIHSLRRFKEDVRSVKAGYECGIGIENFQDLKEGDLIESYKKIEVAREE